MVTSRSIGFLILALGGIFGLIGCVRMPSPTPSIPTPSGPTAPEAMECPSFAAFGGLPFPVPIPVPLPGADVRGSASPLSDPGRVMDQALRPAIRQVGLQPQRTCFFEVRSEGREGVLGIYQFSSTLGAEVGDRLAEALRGQGIEVRDPTTLTSPGGSVIWMGLQFPDGVEGALMGLQNMIWAWATERAGPIETVEPTQTPGTAPEPSPAPTEAPPTVQPVGLAQEVDAALRPALEKALGVQLALEDFATLTAGGAIQASLSYRPDRAIAYAERVDRLQSELTRVGLTIAATVSTPDQLTLAVQGGRLGNRVVAGGGINIRAEGVEVMLVFSP